jgi:hypothetical protein
MGQCQPKERGLKQSFKELQEKDFKGSRQTREAMRVVHRQWIAQHT